MNKFLHTVNIERLSHECRGIGRMGEKTAFVLGALPGETVECYVLQKHRQYIDACTTRVMCSSKERALPPCPHFLTCGGCSLQHIKPEAQVQFKQTVLLEQLKHVANVVPERLLETVTGPLWGYRHKARLGVRYVKQKEKLLVGFREVQGRYLADITHCGILHPRVGSLLHALRDLIMQLSIPKDIAQIEVAAGDEDVALIFRHLKPLSANDHLILAAFGKQHGLHLYLQPGNPASVHKIYPDDQNQRLYYTLQDYALTLGFHPTDFTQINPDINRKMVALALKLLNVRPHEHVLDLFCGLGNFTLSLARVARHVTGIEGCEQMVARAYENAKRNNIDNVRFYAQDLTANDLTAPYLQDTYDKVLIDPPRSGADAIIQKIGPLKIPMIVYVSCNPATLSRDAAILTKQWGYTLKAAGILDMFPHTAHVESIALFELT